MTKWLKWIDVHTKPEHMHLFFVFTIVFSGVTLFPQQTATGIGSSLAINRYWKFIGAWPIVQVGLNCAGPIRFWAHC